MIHTTAKSVDCLDSTESQVLPGEGAVMLVEYTISSKEFQESTRALVVKHAVKRSSFWGGVG